MAGAGSWGTLNFHYRTRILHPSSQPRTVSDRSSWFLWGQQPLSCGDPSFSPAPESSGLSNTLETSLSRLDLMLTIVVTTLAFVSDHSVFRSCLHKLYDPGDPLQSPKCQFLYWQGGLVLSTTVSKS